MKNILLILCAMILIVSGCMQKITVPVSSNSIVRESWGQSDSLPVELVTLTNKNGMIIKITNYGGILTYVAVPDKNDSIGNVVLGFDNLEQYKQEHPYFGSFIGRYGNRIGGAEFRPMKRFTLLQQITDPIPCTGE